MAGEQESLFSLFIDCLKYLRRAISCCHEGGGDAGVAVVTGCCCHHQSQQHRGARVAHLFPWSGPVLLGLLLCFTEGWGEALWWVQSQHGWEMASFRCGWILRYMGKDRGLRGYYSNWSHEKLYRCNMFSGIIYRSGWELHSWVQCLDEQMHPGFCVWLLVRAVSKNIKSWDVFSYKWYL